MLMNLKLKSTFSLTDWAVFFMKHKWQTILVKLVERCETTMLLRSLKNTMVRFFIFALLSSPVFAENEESKIIGSWRSDAKATHAYLDKHAKFTDYQKKAFANFFGKVVITFKSDGTGTMLTEAFTIPKKGGGEFEMKAANLSFTFKVLDSSESQIVIKSDMKESLFDDYPFALLKFEDDDTYSVSLSDGISEINGREFFKRIKATDKGQGADRPLSVE